MGYKILYINKRSIIGINRNINKNIKQKTDNRKQKPGKEPVHKSQIKLHSIKW